MVIKNIFIGSVLSLFIWQGIADAASMSTRVRILESKVYKQDKKIRASEQAQKASSAKVDKSLAKMQALEKKITTLLKDQKKANKRPKADKRYAFP